MPGGGIPHISTGDLFRANISRQTGLGKRAKVSMDVGDLVPDELTIAMAKDRMQQPDAENGFLLDGFPRNVSQAEALDELLKTEGSKLDAVLDLEVPGGEVIKRIAGRRICRSRSAHVDEVMWTRSCGRGHAAGAGSPRTPRVRCVLDGVSLSRGQAGRERGGRVQRHNRRRP